ncbi:hypothetical protein [Paludisphaera soli]|uniref:hypothetical protein n=1 Tax=Paludisphaera soli TaxID=2712865 RepID=UPI0013EBCB6F|nr:hypothetical protein [Paludisphaera soli]
MSGERRDHPEQEISIRRREHELFVQESVASGGPVKSFPEYLREVPAAPLSAGLKAALWAVALLAAILFAVALWRLVNRPTPRTPSGRGRARASSPAAPRKAAAAPTATPIVAARSTTPPNQEASR